MARRLVRTNINKQNAASGAAGATKRNRAVFSGLSKNQEPSLTRAEDGGKILRASDTILYDHFGEVVKNEIKLRKSFFRNLLQTGEINSFAIQQMLVIPLDEDDQRREELKEYLKYAVRQPDFYFPKHRLIVEVNGKIHNRNELVMRKDAYAEPDFKRLGLDIQTIPDDELVRREDIEFWTNKILSLIKDAESSPTFEADYAASRQKVNRWRNKYRSLSVKKVDIGKPESPKNLKPFNEHGITAVKCWRGLNFHLKSGGRKA